MRKNGYIKGHNGKARVWVINNNILAPKDQTEEILSQPEVGISALQIILNNFAEEGEWLYFICAMKFDGNVKIGRSVDPHARVKQLQTGNPHKLIVYKAIKYNPAINIETIAHKYFRDVRVLNEWFKLTLECVDIIYYELTNECC